MLKDLSSDILAPDRPAAGAGPAPVGAAELGVLLARVRAAGGPDHSLDRALANALHQPGDAFPAYTGSLDAAFGVLERVLPAWAVETCRYGHPGGARAAIWPEGLRPERCHEAIAATPELAVLAACLEALAADAARVGRRRVGAQPGLRACSSINCP